MSHECFSLCNIFFVRTTWAVKYNESDCFHSRSHSWICSSNSFSTQVFSGSSTTITQRWTSSYSQVFFFFSPERRLQCRASTLSGGRYSPVFSFQPFVTVFEHDCEKCCQKIMNLEHVCSFTLITFMSDSSLGPTGWSTTRVWNQISSRWHHVLAGEAL